MGQSLMMCSETPQPCSPSSPSSNLLSLPSIEMEIWGPPLPRFFISSLCPSWNEPGCFEKWDIAPNGFQTPQKFIRKQSIVKVGADVGEGVGVGLWIVSGFVEYSFVSHNNLLQMNKWLCIFSTARSFVDLSDQHVLLCIGFVGVTKINWIAVWAWLCLNTTFVPSLDKDVVSLTAHCFSFLALKWYNQKGNFPVLVWPKTWSVTHQVSFAVIVLLFV